MTEQTRKMQRAQLMDKLEDFAIVAKTLPPGGGWARAIREALSMTHGQLAQRLSISRQSVQDLEQAEADRRIKLDSLDRLAAAMRCRVVYALVPLEGTLDTMRTARAERLAEQMMEPVAHSMVMEAQGVATKVRARRREALVDELLSGSARSLWK